MKRVIKESLGIIAASILLTDTAAFLQLYLVEVDKVGAIHFLIPTIVGFIFGTILILTRHYYRKSKQAEKFETAAKTDFLTGVLNRYAFYEYIENEIERSQRKGRVFCIAMMDLDDFKRVNDIYGHQTGDDILVSFCELVQSRLRSMDRFNRWGGEEFVLLMPETTLDEALKITERIRKEVQSGDFGLDRPLTVSIGVTQSGASDDIESLLKRADSAMYRAKKMGKNRVVAG